MNAIGVFTLVPLLTLICFASARWALVGVFGGVLYMTYGQSIDVLGFNMYPMRVLTLAAFIRVLARREWQLSMINDIDKAVLLTYCYRSTVCMLNGNSSATEQIGLLVDTTMSYFAFRGLLGSFDDLEWFLRKLTLLLVPYVLLLFVESSTWHNPFAILGEVADAGSRGGRPRCTGSFRHAILLGTFGASFLPLFMALSLPRRDRLWGIVGSVLCLAIVLFSNSGAPLSCAMIAVIGWMCWLLRRKMSAVRTSLVAVLVLLAFVMKDPLWYLPAKISLASGGHGWHRSYLMDVAFRNIDKWWLAGMSPTETADWFPYKLVFGTADITNYFLDFGLAAGIAALGLFCWLLVLAFSRLGRALHMLRSSARASLNKEWLLWGLGVTLTLHVFNWIGITYFDQTYFVFFMQLAAISTLSHQCLRERIATQTRTNLLAAQNPRR